MKEGDRMTLIAHHHWYISINCTYPAGVRQIDLRHTAGHYSYELIEMTRKATPKEIETSCLLYIGRGYQENETIMKKIAAFDELTDADILAMKKWRFSKG